MSCRDPVNATQGCEVHPVLSQQLRGAKDAVEAPLTRFVFPIGVVQMLGAVNREADKKVFFMEKLAPAVVQQYAVGLEIVLAPHMGRAVLLLQLDDFPEEIESEEGRFAALPGKDHLFVVLTFKVLADECLEHLVGYAPALRFA